MKYNNYQRRPVYRGYSNPCNNRRTLAYRNHPLLWTLIVVLCLGVGWLAADHFLGGSTNGQPVTSKRVIKNSTVNNKPSAASNSASHAPQSISATNKPVVSDNEIEKLQSEMNQLDVSNSDQAKAISFFEKQKPKNQVRIIKVVKLANRLVPSNALKRKVLTWILN